LGDFDQDGDLDVAAGNQDGWAPSPHVLVYENSGNTFTQVWSSAYDSLADTGYYGSNNSMVVADFDGNGTPDLLV